MLVGFLNTQVSILSPVRISCTSKNDNLLPLSVSSVNLMELWKLLSVDSTCLTDKIITKNEMRAHSAMHKKC